MKAVQPYKPAIAPVVIAPLNRDELLAPEKAVQRFIPVQARAKQLPAIQMPRNREDRERCRAEALRQRSQLLSRSESSDLMDPVGDAAGYWSPNTPVEGVVRLTIGMLSDSFPTNKVGNPKDVSGDPDIRLNG